MKSFHRLRLGVLMLFFFYTLSAQFLIPLNNWKEIIPFFHWNLFSGSEGTKSFYRVEIVRNGQSCYFPDCPEWKDWAIEKRWFYKFISWGMDIDTKEKTPNQLFNEIDQTLLKHINRPFTFKFTRFDVYPEQYLKTGEIVHQHLLISKEVRVP